MKATPLPQPLSPPGKGEQEDTIPRPEIGADRWPSPFDSMAADYDQEFGDNVLVNIMRRAVYRRADACFQPGDRILELNCGTGEDAAHFAARGVQVLATDISGPMIEVAREKVERLGIGSLVGVRRMAAEQLPQLPMQRILLGQSGGAGFDGAFSNFGGLNCVADLSPVADGLARLLRPKATAFLCIMGPICPWEWTWYLGRREPSKAFRRLRTGGSPWRGTTIHYPSIQSARRSFARDFRLRRVHAIGALFPGTYAEEWARRHPRLIFWLNAWERRLEAVPPLPWLADHYLLELERL